MAEFVKLAKSKGESAKSWSVPVAEALEATGTYDLSAKNPNRAVETEMRSPKAILDNMRELDAKTNGLLDKIKQLIG